MDSIEAIDSHPKVGASWEGFAIEQILRKTASSEAYFWGTQSGAELDLLLFENGKRIGYEFKYSEKTKVSRSMRVAMSDLRLGALCIVCPSDVSVPLGDGIEVVGLQALLG